VGNTHFIIVPFFLNKKSEKSRTFQEAKY
jgi:hypothetical protein